MSGSQQNPWSNNPNAPKISYGLYSDEKSWFAGVLTASILYGIVTTLSFKCVAALLNPVYRRGEPIKWGLVSYTAAMFSFVTVQIAVTLYIQSISFIDNRKFPGIKDVTTPGPVGYGTFTQHEAFTIVANGTFFLSGWLADGLLLYRCYAIYSMSLWVIAFPCLVYLGSLAMGVMFIYQVSATYTTTWSALPYYSITLLLNVLLTLMISVRLILHTRRTRATLGITAVSRLCNAVVTMLVESCALYAASLLLIISAEIVKSPIANFFSNIIPGTQVIASLLIIRRVANKSAMTSNTIASEHLSSVTTGGQGQLMGSSDLPGGHPISSMDRRGIRSGELGTGVKTAVDSHQGEVSGASESDASLPALIAPPPSSDHHLPSSFAI